ncbi:alpha-1,6-mannosyl-glycoprotein 2-beta-N-acetylglucosaminyltransferase-like [Halichondria panicea]|uniref:alpha-1,6-mannosyl-glycoprotein 2-beta-N-acetylglucosaminyltransferase-like n=1 Tax=Halichondria panicea TaxID=6063 RepID=UPI00312B8CEB
MTLLGVGLPRRGSLFRKLMIGGILMFISCWITVLMLQNSADSSVSNTGRSQDHKLPYMPAHNNVPRDENVYIKKNSTVKQQQDSVGKNTPHFPRKTLLSTREHSATNKTNQNTTIKAAHKSVPRIDSIPSMNGPNSVELLRKKLVTLNREERILNADKFAPLGNDDIILIVQVHKRVAYLRQLLDSLRAARGVEEVLLVVSSDYYYEEMNQIVESVDFCKVLQIFYPFSLQGFPDSFPGQSKTDCPRDVNREKAIEMNCTNALHPDSFGHYREAKVTAIKHHWWWKVNTVFDHLRVTTDFNGYVFFLEEDHYLSPDFVHVAKRLVALKREQCQDCDLVNMGTYQKSSFAAMSSQASPSLWNAGKNNMGFGMDRSTWNTIKGCREVGTRLAGPPHS